MLDTKILLLKKKILCTFFIFNIQLAFFQALSEQAENKEVVFLKVDVDEAEVSLLFIS